MYVENSKLKTQNSKQINGFTLIELLFVFSVFAVLSTIGVASFVTYSRSQTLSVAVLDIATLLNSAKSKSSSQVKPLSCGANTLDGYKVVFCGLPASVCPALGTYQLRVVCGPLETVVVTKKIPTSLQFDDNSTETTSVSYFFKTVTGGMEGVGKLTVEGYGNRRSVQVDALGNIAVN